MRLLLVTPFLPDPAGTHGGSIYLGALCRSLRRTTELGLVALATADERQGPAARDETFGFRRLVAVRERPTGRGRRRHQARMLFDWGLRRLPLVAAKAWHPGLPAVLERALAEFRPDAALVELAQMAQYLPFLRSVPTVLTDHEAGLPANVHTGLGRWADRRDLGLWRRYVQRFHGQADLLQAVTAEDAAELQQMLGREVAVRPPTVAVPPSRVRPDAAPPRALFLGDYRHGPNPEAAARLARSVWPAVRERVPGAELWLAGPNEHRVRDLATVPGVRVLGFVADLPALFAQVRVMLAPLWSGTGVRMKGITALAHGLPVVTNALGARGCAAPAPARLVADADEDLAERTVRFLRDAEFADEAGRAAHAFALAHLDDAAVAAAQLERITALLGRRRG